MSSLRKQHGTLCWLFSRRATHAPKKSVLEYKDPDLTKTLRD